MINLFGFGLAWLDKDSIWRENVYHKLCCCLMVLEGILTLFCSVAICVVILRERQNGLIVNVSEALYIIIYTFNLACTCILDVL